MGGSRTVNSDEPVLCPCDALFSIHASPYTVPLQPVLSTWAHFSSIRRRAEATFHGRHRSREKSQYRMGVTRHRAGRLMTQSRIRGLAVTTEWR